MNIENLIVIVTYNSQDFIEDCISSVVSSDIKKYFLVVIDNNSTDSTLKKLSSIRESLEASRELPKIELKRETSSLTTPIPLNLIAEEHNFKFITLNKNIGFAAAVNYCVFKFFLKEFPEAAKNTQFLILINPDVRVEKNALSNLISTFDKLQDGAGAAGSLIYDYGGEKIQHAGGLIQENFLTNHIEKIPGCNNRNCGLIEADYATGAVFATKFKYFLNFKGFDTGYRPVYFEEVDYCLKLRRLNLKTIINTESVARHYEGASIGKFSADFYRYYHKNRLRCAVISLSPAMFFKRFMPAEIKWLREKATHDQCPGIFFAYFSNFLFLIYNLTVKIKNSFVIKNFFRN